MQKIPSEWIDSLLLRGQVVHAWITLVEAGLSVRREQPTSAEECDEAR